MLKKDGSEGQQATITLKSWMINKTKSTSDSELNLKTVLNARKFITIH